VYSFFAQKIDRKQQNLWEQKNIDNIVSVNLKLN
jgi:hypothetical protein